MTANNEMFFLQLSEIGSRIYRGLCMNLSWSGELPALIAEFCRVTAECEYAELWRFDRSSNELCRLTPPKSVVSARVGLMGRAVAEKQAVTASSDEPLSAAVPAVRSALAMPVVNEDSELVGVLRLINKQSAECFTEWDIRRLSAAAVLCAPVIEKQRMSGKAYIDKLTGLRNRRGLLADLSSDGRFGRLCSEGDLSFFICDIDKFTSINEIHGQSEGDSILRSVAYTLAESCRSEDTVYRLGGEEFVLVMPNTRLKECAAIAESFRVKIQDRQFVVGGENIRLTLSFGCCRFDPALSAEGNISAADAKLFTAKESGRNRVNF